VSAAAAAAAAAVIAPAVAVAVAAAVYIAFVIAFGFKIAVPTAVVDDVAIAASGAGGRSSSFYFGTKKRQLFVQRLRTKLTNWITLERA
jgi:hypothetical protein